jgi:hypothetical protein
MNQSNEFFPDEGEIEARAMLRALSIVQVIADPAGAAKRMKELSKATADARAASEAAAKTLAELDARQAAMTTAEASLAERTLQFQTWIDSTEKSYREREDRIRVNEETGAARESKLANEQADLERRVAAHQEQLRQMKAHLGEVA